MLKHFQVKVAHTTFWGKRQDSIIDIDDIKLLSDTAQNESAGNNFWKMEFYDEKRKPLFISTKYGKIHNMDKFQHVFGQTNFGQNVPKPQILFYRVFV